MCSVTLRPQDVGRGHGFDECARRGGEFPVRGGQRVRLQLGQCDVLGLSGHGEMPQPDMQTFFEAVSQLPKLPVQDGEVSFEIELTVSPSSSGWK